MQSGEKDEKGQVNVGFEGADLGKADGDGEVKSTAEGRSPGMGIQTMGLWQHAELRKAIWTSRGRDRGSCDWCVARRVT